MYVKARVTAGARKESVEAESENRLRIAVREPAKQNLANERVRELVARHFRVPVGKVRIVNGHQSPSKMLSVEV